VVATAWSEDVARAALDAGADDTLVRVFGSPDEPLPAGLRPLLPRVVWPEEAEPLSQWLDGYPVTVGNLGMVPLAASRGPVEADWPLNVLNAHAAAALDGIGAGFVWASPELSGRQLARLVGWSPLPIGVVIWGRTELMVAEQCVLQASGPCNRRCASCARRRGWWRLRDQKGYEFPVTTDSSGRSHIMNAVTLDLTRALDEVLASGVAAVRLDFSEEPPERAEEITRAVCAAIEAVAAGAPPPAATLVEPATSGHFFRGVR
jgi:putative protease